MHDCVIGLERHGVHAGILTHFTVQTANVGPGRLDVHIVNPSGRAELVRLRHGSAHNMIYTRISKILDLYELIPILGITLVH